MRKGPLACPFPVAITDTSRAGFLWAGVGKLRPRAAVEAGAGKVMTAHMEVTGVAAMDAAAAHGG
jgi:hypothetical protein